MNVLLINDDGIDSIGLQKMAEEMSGYGDIYVVAPGSERSSNSHSLTIKGNLHYEERKLPFAKKAYAVYGSPADCAYVGLDFLLQEKMDLVVSGINKGRNLSTDIIYSGTIAAAREAYLHRIPAVAISIDSFSAVYYETAAKYCRQIALEYLKRPDKLDYFLNINVPDLPYEEIKGIRICDRAARFHYDNNLCSRNIDGKDYIFINSLTMTVECDLNDPRIDYNTVNAGYVAVSPLHDDHFDHKRVTDLESYLL